MSTNWLFGAPSFRTRIGHVTVSAMAEAFRPRHEGVPAPARDSACVVPAQAWRVGEELASLFGPMVLSASGVPTAGAGPLRFMVSRGRRPRRHFLLTQRWRSPSALAHDATYDEFCFCFPSPARGGITPDDRYSFRRFTQPPRPAPASLSSPAPVTRLTLQQSGRLSRGNPPTRQWPVLSFSLPAWQALLATIKPEYRLTRRPSSPLRNKSPGRARASGGT